MAKRILTRCGYRCDLCLAYHPNVLTHPENQKKLSDGWFKFFGFRIEPEKLICDGCMAEEPQLIDSNCPVRPCAMAKNLDNCTQCTEYLCPKLESRLVRPDFAAKAREQGATEDEYYCFIEPYENHRRLEALRAAKDLGLL